MDLNLILNVLLIVFVIVVGTMLTLVLFRAYVILWRVERILRYADHIRGILQIWERVPVEMLKKITGFWSK